MPRQDLLAITLDDLVTFTNRGTVNRAQKEFETPELSCEFLEGADGTISAKWSDGATCSLPGNKTAREGRCSCPSVGMCRHLVRTILMYQRAAAAKAETPAAPQEAWDPGEIGDDVLSQHIPKATLDRARLEFEKGILADVLRAPKPVAVLPGHGVNVRFLVRGDPRYTHVDCGPELAPHFTALAVWAFRALPKEKTAGLVSTATAQLPVPAAALDEAEQTALSLLEHGFSAAPDHFHSTLTRLGDLLLAEGLVWPQDNVATVADQFQRYSARDALFSAETAVESLGELLLRCDAIRSQTTAVPQALIRGTRDDRPLDLKTSRFVGLGCGVQALKKGAALSVYLQDQDSGMVVAIMREFANPADPKIAPADYSKLAQTAAVQSSSFALLGQGTLLLSGGRRTAARRLTTARARSTVNPQAFQWENLREPVRVDSFEELRERLSTLPPAALRPHRAAENFHVLRVVKVEHANFDAARQLALAQLEDSDGCKALLIHPYTERGRHGTEALIAMLEREPQTLRFVAGTVKTTAEGLAISPTAVVCEQNGTRRMIQPWIGAKEEHESRAAIVTPAHSASAKDFDAVAQALLELQQILAELLVLGFRRTDGPFAKRVQEWARHSEAGGFVRLTSRVDALAEELELRQHSVRWSCDESARIVLELAVMLRLAMEI